MSPNPSKLLVRFIAVAGIAAAAWAWRSHAHHERGPGVPAAASEAARQPPSDASARERAERDPQADLEGQMQWDPLTRTYHGG